MNGINLSRMLETISGRKPLELVPQSEAGGRVILVTGAGGSIGSALARHLLVRATPQKLILLDNSEYNLHRIILRLNRGERGDSLIPVLGDVTDEALLRELFRTYKPEYVFHAAAYKQVPLLEEQVCSAARNNTLGTYFIAKAAAENGALCLVMLSTDKVVNPASIMGASKRLAELVLAGLSNSRTRMTSVRFGNVLGSRGSVVPLFLEQLRHRSSLTVTHPSVCRYFLTMREAVGAILEAARLGAGSDVLVPDLGDPVKVVRIAEYLIKSSDAPLAKGPSIIFTGLRPGEKLTEALFFPYESAKPTNAPGIRSVKLIMSAEYQEDLMRRIEVALNHRDARLLIKLIKEAVPEYIPSREVVNGKMVFGDKGP